MLAPIAILAGPGAVPPFSAYGSGRGTKRNEPRLPPVLSLGYDVNDLQEHQRGGGALLRVLGLGFGIAVLVGNTIGSGILRTPGEIAGHLPSVGLFLGIWIAGGIYALLGSNALTEVAAITRESGGYTVFVRRGLGPYLGFVAGWSDWLSICSSTSAAVIFLGESVIALMRWPGSTLSAVAAAVLIAFTALQWIGIRTASTTQNVTSVAKGFAFLAFIVVCFSYAGETVEPALPKPLPSGVPLIMAMILAMQAVIFTYDGWVGPSYFAGELRDPGRQLPRSIFGGVAVVIVLYMLVNIALLQVVPIQRLAGDKFAAGTVATTIFGPRGDLVLRLLVVLVLLSAINAWLLMASRSFYGVSRANGLLIGARVNKGGTPDVALLVSTVASLGFLLTGSYERVIAVTAFLFVANYTFTYLSLFALRRREPETHRPYRAWGHPWTTGFVLVISLGLLAGAMVADRRNSMISIGLLLASFPLYRLLAARAKRS